MSVLETFVGDGFSKLGWVAIDSRIDYLAMLLNDPHTKIAASMLAHAIFEIQLACDAALKGMVFVSISTPSACFFENENLFGKSVRSAFPSAKEEIKAAGNCMAVGLDTAAVFHLMRAAEFGMRALAVKLNVKLKRKPIEHAGWNELIEQIEKKIRDRRERYDKSRKKNKKELEFLKFCRMMADELFIFKEIWRNNTMHSISSYNASEAMGVFNRVQSFMQRLAAKISEEK